VLRTCLFKMPCLYSEAVPRGLALQRNVTHKCEMRMGWITQKQAQKREKTSQNKLLKQRKTFLMEKYLVTESALDSLRAEADA
jgi:hypothetical protein